MPPRLLDAPFEEFGPPPEIWEGPHGYLDTLAEFQTFWSFDSEELKSISNQYAAMPSLHAAWSTWSALVMATLVRRRWVRGLVWLYPVATLFCIIVTANHFWLDAVGGLAVLGAGFLAGRALARYWERRALAAAAPTAPAPATA
jgi:membrane-associated phospholipid phosphatase